jgi:hypothetical protein
MKSKVYIFSDMLREAKKPSRRLIVLSNGATIIGRKTWKHARGGKMPDTCMEQPLAKFRDIYEGSNDRAEWAQWEAETR